MYFYLYSFCTNCLSFFTEAISFRKHKQGVKISFLCLVLLGCFHGTTTARHPQDITIGNQSLQLEFGLQSGVVKHWRLPTVQTTQDQVKDLAAPAGAMFALRGTLWGKSLREWQSIAGGWKILEHNTDEITLILRHADLPFTVKKSWRLVDHPWRVDFSLSLTLHEQDQNNDDGIWLRIGPGVGEVPVQGSGVGRGIYAFTELVYRDDKGVNTLRLKGDRKTQLFTSEDAGPTDWFGLQSRYFALVLAPVNGAASELAWFAQVPDVPRWHTGNVDFETSLQIAIPLIKRNGEPSLQWEWSIFGGGKTYSALSEGVPDLRRLLFSGMWNWMRGLTLAIMHVLDFIQGCVKNWGFAIIILAVLVRVVLHPVAKNTLAAQKKYAAIQEKIQPQLNEIRRQYKGGEQSERILQLYEHHRVSPLAGLKPLLIVVIQIPIFVALYHLIGQTFELQFAPFLWMSTLSEPDQLFPFGVEIPFFGSHFNLLPVLMAFTTLLSIKLSPSTLSDHAASRRQNIFLGFMALGFFLLFYSFPSGMVLYWLTANLLQIAHQKLLTV
jgi:YidC/Oxa1 family membrane protein insertase